MPIFICRLLDIEVRTVNVMAYVHLGLSDLKVFTFFSKHSFLKTNMFENKSISVHVGRHNVLKF